MGPPPPPRSWQAPQTLIEREFAGVVGSRNPNLVVDDSLTDDVIVYPAKKSKAPVWRKVSAKTLEREPKTADKYGYHGPAAYGPPPPPGAYMRR